MEIHENITKSISEFLETICSPGKVVVREWDQLTEFVIDNNAILGFNLMEVEGDAKSCLRGLKRKCINLLRDKYPANLKPQYRGKKVLDGLPADEHAMMFGDFMLKHMSEFSLRGIVDTQYKSTDAYRWFVMDLHSIDEEWFN